MSVLIRNLCEKYTNLTEEDIDIIIEKSEVLADIASKTDQDVFIDCPCIQISEAVVVAEALKKDSLYQLSTLGCIVREEDEPAVFRTFRSGEETEEVEATIFSSRLEGRVIQNVQPIKNKDKTIGVLIFERPTKEDWPLKRNTKKLMANTAGTLPILKDCVWITEYFDDALIIVSENGVILYRNTVAAKLYRKQGYVYDILGQEYSKVSLHGELLPKDGKRSEADMKIGAYYYRIRQFNLKDKGVFLIVIRDITELRINEQELILKSTAIQEIHHRIKNNLQTVHSLLRLQWRRAKSVETQTALSDAMNRILSIATTHESLLYSGVDEISLFTVIEEIKKNFTDLMNLEKQKIEIDVTGDDLRVSSDISSSTALVINELIQNSLKYAFENRKNGRITIAVSEGNMGYANITVTDNGTGYEVQQENKSLGLKIVENLVQNKLKGRLEIQSGNGGTQVTFDFKIK